jgi:hypothetical protein
MSLPTRLRAGEPIAMQAGWGDCRQATEAALYGIVPNCSRRQWEANADEVHRRLLPKRNASSVTQGKPEWADAEVTQDVWLVSNSPNPVANRTHAVSLMKAGPPQCRFILTEPPARPICCGAPLMDGSWCPAHPRLVHVRSHG